MSEKIYAHKTRRILIFYWRCPFFYQRKKKPDLFQNILLLRRRKKKKFLELKIKDELNLGCGTSVKISHILY